MKIRKMVEIITETYEEQQFILSRFPNSFWFVEDDENNLYKTRFYISELKQTEAVAALNEWRDLSRR